MRSVLNFLFIKGAAESSAANTGAKS